MIFCDLTRLYFNDIVTIDLITYRVKSQFFFLLEVSLRVYLKLVLIFIAKSGIILIYEYFRCTGESGDSTSAN